MVKANTGKIIFAEESIYMSTFGFASVVMRIISDETWQFAEIKKFELPESSPADITLCMKRCDFIHEPEGSFILDEGIKWTKNSVSEHSFYVCAESSGMIVFKVDINENWNEAVVYYLKDKLDGEYAFTGPVGEILFRNLILSHQGISIHASGLKFDEKGIIFSAPSGIGKTTQAEMWKKIKKAEIVNGDRPAIKIINQTPYVYGTPWSGSSGVFSNNSAPLKAIVMLEQSSSNEIHRLNNRDAVSMLLPRCFLPFFNEKLMCLAINNLDHIIARTPVYLLKCTKDIEAVELVYKCIS